MLVRTYSNWDFHALLEGRKMVNLEFGLTVYIRLNIYLSNDLDILFLGIYPRGMKTYIHKKDQFKNVHSSFIHNSQKLGIIQIPSAGIGLNYGTSIL